MRLTLLLVISICGSCFAALYEPMQPPFATWVDDGKPLARIVTDEFAPDSVQPADLLNEYLEKISGAKLPVVAESEGGAAETPTVYIGPKCGLGRIAEADRAQIGPEGFCIVSTGRDLIISGLDQLSTTYGVCAFLEECLGVRWFWAHSSGTYVPRHRTLRVGQVHKVQNPDFPYRCVGRNEWALANRMNVRTGQPGEFATKWFVHTFLRLVPPEKYWPDHPEYYAERGGKRQDPTARPQRQLCTSNPDVAEVVAQSIDEIMEREPGIKMISVDPMDSQDFCQCENCLALDEPGAPYPRQNSRRLVLFYNRVAELVAKKHPDLLVKSIAYLSYVAPPADPDLRVHDNVVIQFCRFECHNHPLFDPHCPKNKEFNEQYLGWSEIARNVIFYEYYWKVSWLHLPWPIVHTLQQELPYLRDQGLMGVATQYTSNFGTHGLGYYVAAKLLWDADIDVDALVEDFCEKAYGDAAGPMADYYDRLERGAIESGVHIADQRPYITVLALFTPELLRDLGDAVAAAKAAARDEQTTERIDLVDRGLQYTHLVVDYLQTVADVRGSVSGARWLGSATADLKAEAERLARPKAEAIRAFIEDPANHPAIGDANNYIELMLTPRAVLGQWRESWQTVDAVELTKAEWLQDHGQQLSPELPAELCLWVYGNDLDFVGGKPEHTILVETGEGTEAVVGHVGTPERPGDGVNRCYVLRGLKRDWVVDGKLGLIVTNDEGGPYASRFFAFYVMPEIQDVDDDLATRKIETDLEWVRQQAIGFTEYGYAGLRSDDGERDKVDIALEGLPVGLD